MPATDVTTGGQDLAATAARSTNLPAGTTANDAASTGGTHHRHRRAAQDAVAANTTQLDLHVGPAGIQLTLPPADKLAFYAGLAGAAALGVIEWPIALINGIGHLLSDDRRNRTLRALGEALDAV